MARPIPKSMLIHSATQKYGIPTDDGWGNKTWPSSRTLSRVRFEPSTKLALTKENQQVQLRAVMFFDCRNSAPLTAAFAVGDRIQQTGGEEYSIASIEPLSDNRNLHHFEIGLV
jgi:hypothetical protein